MLIFLCTIGNSFSDGAYGKLLAVPYLKRKGLFDGYKKA